MIEYFLAVGHQILMMFLIVVVGYCIVKFKVVSEEGIKQLSVLLLKIVVPMILISSFQRDFEINLFVKWLIMFVVSMFIYAVQIALATVLYRDRSIRGFAESRLCLVLPNNGFLAFPLMMSLVGDLGIFYGSTNVIILNILQWTYGLKLFKPDEKLDAKKIFLNPGTISVFIGLLLFVSPYKLPQPVFEAVDAIGSLNTPVAMIVLGGLIAQTDLKKEIKQPCFYKLSFVKLIILPLIIAPVLKIMPFSNDIKLIGFICAVTPAATSISMISQLYDGEYRYATSAIVIMTILSAITIPIILAIGSGILGY